MNRTKNKPYFAYRSFWKEFDAMKNFTKIGVNQFCVFAGHSANSLGEPYSQYDAVWKWYDTYDFTPFDEQMNDVLKICPAAEILCMIDLNSPLWLARQLHVDSYPQLSNALSDEKWKEETEKFIRAFVDYAEKRYSNRILCYIIMCGKTDEWMDHSEGTETASKLKYYQKWCMEHGVAIPTDAPTVRQRDEAPRENGTFRDPALNQAAIQYWKFHSELIADSIIHFASIVKERVDAEKKVGIFYGYILELETAAVSLGHLAYEKLEGSVSIDFVISPGDYHDRPMGGGSGFMTPNGTVHLHNKGCLYEIDHRTHSANMNLTPYVELKWMDRWKNLDEDRAGLRREFCRALFHGASLWWFDMWGRFYQDPENIAVIGQCRTLWEKFADASFEPDAEIALIVDPESTFLISQAGSLAKPYRSIQNILNRLGTPHEIYSMNDLPKLPARIRFLIFAGVIELTAAKQTMLENHIWNKIPCFWYGPSGLTDGKTWKQQELHGITFPDIPKLTPEILRHKAEMQGIHFYAEKYCPVWAGRGLISVHTAEGGPMKIRLKKKAERIVELFSGRIVGEDCVEFSYNFSEPETALFQAIPSRDT